MILHCTCGRAVDVRETTVAVTCPVCVARAMMPAPPPEGAEPVKRIPAALKAAVSAHCCNFINGQHQEERPCSVCTGFPCPYFERAVLPVVGIAAQCAYKEAYAPEKAVELRHCECGAVLEPRERMCEKCRRNRSRAAKRKYAKRSRGHVDS